MRILTAICCIFIAVTAVTVFAHSGRTHYDILRLSRDASQEEIKRSFRRLAMRFHPDRTPDGPSQEGEFKLVNEAYQVLGDPKLRAQYDSTLPVIAQSRRAVSISEKLIGRLIDEQNQSIEKMVEIGLGLLNENLRLGHGISELEVELAVKALANIYVHLGPEKQIARVRLDVVEATYKTYFIFLYNRIRPISRQVFDRYFATIYGLLLDEYNNPMATKDIRYRQSLRNVLDLAWHLTASNPCEDLLRSIYGDRYGDVDLHI